MECIVLAIWKQVRKTRPRLPFAIDSVWVVFGGLQLEFSGLFRLNSHYSYSSVVHSERASPRGFPEFYMGNDSCKNECSGIQNVMIATAIHSTLWRRSICSIICFRCIPQEMMRACQRHRNNNIILKIVFWRGGGEGRELFKNAVFLAKPRTNNLSEACPYFSSFLKDSKAKTSKTSREKQATPPTPKKTPTKTTSRKTETPRTKRAGSVEHGQSSGHAGCHLYPCHEHSSCQCGLCRCGLDWQALTTWRREKERLPSGS